MSTINRHYINGRLHESRSTATQPITSAVTGDRLAEGTLGDAEDAAAAIAAAKQALPEWSATTLEERRVHLQRLADSFRNHSAEMAEALVEEFGTTSATAEFIAAQSSDWFTLAQDLLVEDTFTEQLGTATINKVPVGVAALITPWNGASWFIAVKASVALAAGCTVVIKPSERGIWQLQPVIDAIAEAGLPAGVINVVVGAGDPVGNILTTHPDVAKVSVTGSTGTGKLIARNGADTMKRVTAELGGKSATLILDDADTATAVQFALGVGLFNNGQACIAGTRILVPAGRAEEFKGALREGLAQLPVGDPRDPGTVVGPVLDEAQYDRVQHYITTGLEEGGELIAGGPGHPEGLSTGHYVQPTLIATKNDSTLAQEEVFGPVLAVITYDDEDDAVAIANDNEFGLHAYIATGDVDRGARVARRLQAGRVAINQPVDDPRAPFGGFKQSGIGREFGRYGIDAYLETQAIFA